MSDEDEQAGSIALARPEEEALRLKTLAEQKYSSGNLKSALKYAKRAHKLHPSLDGLPEMITAFKILRTAAAPVFETTPDNQGAAPDYYKILQVERFSHLNTIKKQYKHLALALHPDKNPFPASSEAFKLVGDASRLLSDKIRRKEYDMKLRIAMQSEAAEEVGLEAAAETFWTACSACRLLHQFEKIYMGHNLVCPRCKKSFKAMEVKEDLDNGVDLEKSPIKVSARIKDRFAKCGSLGIVERCGLKVKRKTCSFREVLERSESKRTRNNAGDDVLLKDLKLKKVEKLVNGKVSKGNNVENGRPNNAGVGEDDTTMTLSQMKVLVKKEKKQVDGNLMMQENEEEDEREEVDTVQSTLKTYKRRVRKDRSVEIINITSESVLDSEREVNKWSREDNLENEKGTNGKRDKRERRRVIKYGDWEEAERGERMNHEKQTEMERLIIARNNGKNLEIMPVEDSEFHDFDKDRKGRSFKKGQVWAVYDDDDGMPRHYALIDKIVSLNPFEVTLSWLLFQTNGDEDLINWRKMGLSVSCGSFKVSRKISINYLNLFSHVVCCERASREVYRIYPTKGSVWALYQNTINSLDSENGDINNNRCYDIVLCLSSYSNVHGLSIGYLEKVPGFRTVFRRIEIGANAVFNLGKNDVKLFSHQIPAKKLSGEEDSGLPKDCWELDPASLASQLLIGV